jgi:hypothetical protein
MSTDERLELQRLLRIHKRNLFDLQITAAQYGFDKPLKLVNDIKHEEGKIAELKPRFLQITQPELDAFKAMLQVLESHHASKWVFSKIASIISDISDVNDSTMGLLIKGVRDTCRKQIERLEKDIAEMKVYNNARAVD